MTDSTVTASASAQDGRPPVSHAAWMRLAACTAAAALLQLDGTLITVALPSVAHGLGVKGSSTSAVPEAPALKPTRCSSSPAGRPLDRFGVRRLALSPGWPCSRLGPLPGRS